MRKDKKIIIDEYIKKARCFSPVGSYVGSEGGYILIVEPCDSEVIIISMDEIDRMYGIFEKELGIKIDMQLIDKICEAKKKA